MFLALCFSLGALGALGETPTCNPASHGHCAGSDQTTLLQQRVAVEDTMTMEETNHNVGNDAAVDDHEICNGVTEEHEICEDDSSTEHKVDVGELLDEFETENVEEDDTEADDEEESDIKGDITAPNQNASDVPCKDINDQNQCSSSGCAWKDSACVEDNARDTDVECTQFVHRLHCQASGCVWKVDDALGNEWCDEDNAGKAAALIESEEGEDEDEEGGDVQALAGQRWCSRRRHSRRRSCCRRRRASQSLPANKVGCYELHKKYSPTNMRGQGRSVASAEACQARCAKVAGCAHFSRWADGGCHLQDRSARKVSGRSVMTGPPKCVPPIPPTTPAPGQPWACGFEGSAQPFCGLWTNLKGDKFDWTRKTGRTPSCSTGPSRAHSGNYYLYVEASWRRGGDYAVVQSKPMTFGVNAQVTFKYHMYGSHIGELKVGFKETSVAFLVEGEDASLGVTKTLWDKKGHQSTTWQDATVSLAGYAGKTGVVQLTGIIRHGCARWRGDIAVDQLVLTPGTAGAPAATPSPAKPTQAPPAAADPLFQRIDNDKNAKIDQAELKKAITNGIIKDVSSAQTPTAKPVNPTQAPAPAPAVSGSLSQTQKDAILMKHNALRAGMGAADMMKMEWDDALATAADDFVKDCPSGHSKNRPGSVGENMAWKWSSSFQLTASTDLMPSVQSWYDEIDHAGPYKKGGAFNGFKKCTGVCGHYTQVVWAAANKLGCGVKQCPHSGGMPGYELVCQYKSTVKGGYGGNMGGATVFTKGAHCSKCPTGFDTCSNQLCSR